MRRNEKREKEKGRKDEKEREGNKYIYNHPVFLPREAVTKSCAHANSILVAWTFLRKGYSPEGCSMLDRLGVGSRSGEGLVSGS